MGDYIHIFVIIYFKEVRRSQFFIPRKKNYILIICIYLDDIIYMGSSQYLIDEFKLSMMSEFEMTDLGIVHYFLDLEVYQGNHGKFIS